MDEMDEIIYSGERIIIPSPSENFYFLTWLKKQEFADDSLLMCADEVAEVLDSDMVRASDDKKIISMADISINTNILDSDFLYLSKEYRCDIKKEITETSNMSQYTISLWDLSRIIKVQTEFPEMDLLKKFNNFYLRAENGGVIRLELYFEPKSTTFFQVNIEISKTIIDSEKLSGRIFFGI